MNIYVDEMPKECWNCPCSQNDIEWNCGLDDGTNYYFLDEIDGGACPLHSLTDHDQQVCADERKKVCKQIYKIFTNESIWKEIKKYWWLNNGECKELKNILDQVEKGESNED